MSEHKSMATTRAVSLSEFSRHTAELDRLGPGDVGSYAHQLDLLAREQSLNLPLVEPNDKTMMKNRYINILPYESRNRVLLETINQDPSSSYINASYIRNVVGKSETCFIATQAPVHWSINDFWRMIWEKNSPLVVMLTVETEKGRVKAESYWTESGDTRKYGNISVRLTNPHDSDQSKICHKRVFELQRGGETREVTQLQFKRWPDHGVPISMSEMVLFMQEYRTLRDKLIKQPDMPVVVHCSAGIGRTGCFVLMDSLLDYASQAILDKHVDPQIDMYAMLKKIREGRPGSVQTVEQYRFCYKFFEFCIRKSLFGVNVPQPKEIR